jgi:hypothetical protein
MKKLAVFYLGSVDCDVGGLDGHDRGILNHQSTNTRTLINGVASQDFSRPTSTTIIEGLQLSNSIKSTNI